MKVICALGAGFICARRVGIKGIESIRKTGMPLSYDGSSFLKLLNPELTDEQASRWYRIIITRNDCQERKSRAWATLKKAALIGQHFDFEEVRDNSGKTGYKPIFRCPDFANDEKAVEKLARPDFGWSRPSDQVLNAPITRDEISSASSLDSVGCFV